MEKLSMCRICLVENVRMCVVTDRSLQETYEKLADVPFVTEDRKPMLACLFCCTRLKQCCQLQRQCVAAEELLAQMLSEDYEQKPLTIQGHLEFVGGLIITPIEQISIVDNCQIVSDAIKQEPPDVCEEQGDVELQLTQPSEELNLENPDKTYPGVEDIPAHDSELHSEDDALLVEMKTAAEEGQVSKRKRRACVTRRAAKTKPTLKRKLKLIIPAKQRINALSGLTTETSTPECVDQTKDPITTASQSSFNQTSNVIQDIRIHTGENPLKCHVCQRSFSNKSNLNKHFQKHSGEKLYKCGICHRTSLHAPIKNNCGKHLFKCDICQRSFCYKSALTEHFLLHTLEKPYKCDICQRSFRKKSNLKTHFQIHTGEKRYKCDICQQGCRDKNSLIRHSRVHTGEKPYKCDVCQRSFTCISSLKKHSRMHTGEKPYKCDVCQRSFNSKSNLTVHSRKHSGEKPYQCDVCQRSFSNKSNLDVHFRKHSDEKSFF